MKLFPFLVQGATRWHYMLTLEMVCAADKCCNILRSHQGHEEEKNAVAFQAYFTLDLIHFLGSL